MTPILALHGFTGSAADWSPLAANLGETILTLDFPGHGVRKLHRDRAQYSLQSHLNLISETVAACPTITLIGYSMGGRLALHWALAHPERVARLILIGASPGLATEAERAERERGDFALAQFLRTQGLEAFYKYWYNQPFFHSLKQLPAAQLEALMHRRMQNDPEGLALSLECVGTGSLPSLWSELHHLRGPVDLVTGEYDPKFRSLALRMAERLPRSRISVVERAGHAVHLEQPADLAQLLRSGPH